MTTTTFGQLVRAVPRVASLRPQLATAALTAVWVLAGSESGEPMRLRFSATAVAATGCFVFDDDAAHTLASVPVTRLTRRAARFFVAVTVAAAWLAVVVPLSGVHVPAAALLEVAVLALLAAAVALVVINSSASERGAGIAGTAAALLCLLTIYLSPHWWVPLTAEPRATRLCVTGAIALAVALSASADPAKRRVRTG